jgi:uncharacterized membrane protein
LGVGADRSPRFSAPACSSFAPLVPSPLGPESLLEGAHAAFLDDANYSGSDYDGLEVAAIASLVTIALCEAYLLYSSLAWAVAHAVRPKGAGGSFLRLHCGGDHRMLDAYPPPRPELELAALVVSVPIPIVVGAVAVVVVVVVVAVVVAPPSPIFHHLTENVVGRLVVVLALIAVQQNCSMPLLNWARGFAWEILIDSSARLEMLPAAVVSGPVVVGHVVAISPDEVAHSRLALGNLLLVQA